MLLVFGTRPEAIKMAPLYHELRRRPEFDVKVCVTAQHRSMLDQVLSLFEITPDFDLDVMRAEQDLTDITVSVLLGLRDLLSRYRPSAVLVQGDTTTTMAASLASFYAKVRIGHVEAGLRTHNKRSPWPEEVNRTLTSALADWHFAPTESARANLLREGLPAEHIHVTGNTVIDALLEVQAILRTDSPLARAQAARFAFLDGSRRLILVTAHRRENFGPGIRSICHALLKISAREDLEIIYPVHPNPNIKKPVTELLQGHPNIHLVEPLDYLPFVYLMDRAYIIVTDSGGIQEEAAALNKPVLVMRNDTERLEGIAAGTAKLTGTLVESVFRSVSDLLDTPTAYERMRGAPNPWGDGTASRQIADILARSDLERAGR